jgi:hypothetical protein
VPNDASELTSDEAAVISGQTLVDLAIGSFNETVLIDVCKGCEVADQADVLTVGRLNRTDATVVGLVYIADFEACTLTGEAARPKRGKTSFKPDFGKGICLFHELGELAAAEEFSHGCHDGANVDQSIGRDLARFRNAHALFYDTLRTPQAHAELRLD